MALGYHEETVAWNAADAVTTKYTIGSLGFTPKAVMVYCMGHASATSGHSGTADWQVGIGFAESGGTRRSVASYSDDSPTTSDCGSMSRDDAVLHTVDGSGALTGALDIEFDTDEIRLVVDDTAPVDLSVIVKIWGGDDISAVYVGTIAEPGATGNVDYTATGMASGANADQVLFLAGVQTTAATNSGTGTDSGIFFGMAHDGGQFVTCVNGDDASGTSDTDQYEYGAECLAQIVLAGGQPSARAAFTQWNTDGFRLNWAERATSNRRSIYMAIKGGQWAVGDFTIDAATPNSTGGPTGLSFAPEGILLACTSGAENTIDTSSTLAMLSIGGGTSSSDCRCLMVREDNGAANMQVWTGVRNDAALGAQSNGTTSRERWGISSMNSDGFTLITDQANAADASDWFIAYAAFASADTEQIVGIGQTTETDSALGVTWRKAKAIGLNTETDLAQAMTRAKRRALGLNTETGAPFAITFRKAKAIGLNTETDLAQVMGKAKRRAIGLNAETDAPFAMTWRKARAIGQPEETDLAQAMGRSKVRAIGLTTETDFAFDITRSGVTIAIGLAEETDSPFSFTWRKVMAIGLAGETDTAQALTRNKARAIGQPSTVEQAFNFTFSKAKAIGLASETDTAQAMGRLKVEGIGLVMETDEAQPFGRRKVKVLGLTTEDDEAQPIRRTILIPIAQAAESSTAFPFTHSKTREIGIALEIDTPFPITSDQVRELYWKLSGLDVGDLEVSVVDPDLLAMIEEVSGE